MSALENSITIENPQNEGEEDILRKLLQNGCSGITEGWMKNKIHDKICVALEVITIESDAKTQKEFVGNLHNKESEKQGDYNTVLSKIKGIQDKIGSINKNVQQFVEIREILIEQMQIMVVFLERHIEPKVEHSMKLNNTLTRKIVEMKTLIEQTEEVHQSKMAEKTRELELCEELNSEISEKATETRQKLEETTSETKQESLQIEALKAGINEAQEIINNIDSTVAATAQLTSKIEVQNDAVKNLHNMAEMIYIEISTFLTRIEQLHFDREVAEGQNAFLNKRFDDLNYLMDFVNRKKEASEMENDPVFINEVMNSSYYIEHKNKLDDVIHDNGVISNDLDNIDSATNDLQQQLEAAEAEITGLQSVITKLQAELDEIDRDEKASQLKERLIEVQKAEEALNQEISDLNAEVHRVKEEYEQSKNLHLENIVRWNLELKQEQTKTRKARKQQIDTPESKLLTLNDSKYLGSQINFHSQFLKQDLKKTSSPRKMFFSQQVKSPNKNSPTSEPESAASKTSSSQQISSTSNNKASPPSVKPLKRQYQETDSNLQDETNAKVSKRDGSRSASYSLKNSSFESDTDQSSVKKSPIAKQDAKQDDVSKENQKPVPTAQEIKAKRIKKAAEEKAFDSDNTSFNITFNTDIDDILEPFL